MLSHIHKTLQAIMMLGCLLFGQSVSWFVPTEGKKTSYLTLFIKVEKSSHPETIEY